ncbi:tRNA (adenosine(37)-N6)-dimethylallyltransferase MiaA [Anoxybacter fermentans]|uniref:tRNA (adenosine(37)-N6)-dimethylallyltransferase MiaA n=1 Tax=Anoxybacter fermentans TaxID=1323375 RepID=UPI00196AFE2C
MLYPLLVIVGPTAVGKTDFSLTLALEINGEIISADSMQIYKKMNIGTAKPSPEELAMVPHHLVDCIPPDQEFTVADFKQRVEIIIPQIYYKGAIPMLVGGTGLYIQAVIEGFIFPEMEIDWDFREKMHQLAKKRGNEIVHAMLKEVDPELAEKLHPNDLRRIIRGLEIFRQTGRTATYWHKRAKEQPKRYDTIKIGLIREREELYQRINERVDLMIEAGLVEEVKGLLDEGYSPDLVSMQGLGYKEIIGYLKGEYDLEEAIYRLKRNTRHFAKRQLTWFKRDKEIIWMNPGEMSTQEMVEKVKRMIDYKWK